MKFKFSKYIAIAAVAVSAASCVGFEGNVLDQPNPNQFSSESFWQTEQNFTGNITAMMNQFRGFDATVLQNAGEFRSDLYWPLGGVDGTSPNSPEIINNQLTSTTTQFSNFAGFYGMISNCNTYLYYDELRGEKALPDAKLRSYIKGMVYGLRAYCYFQIHKMWGTGPIRDINDARRVIGEADYNDLANAKPTAKVEEFLDFIKNDLKLSEDCFAEAGNATSNAVFNSFGGQIYWNPMATQVLAGEVYLWSGKVSTLGTDGTGHKANPADVATAKQHFLNVVNSGKYSLEASYIDAINKGLGNKERIFGTYYAQNEASTNWYNYIQYDPGVGHSIGNYWHCVEADGLTPSKNASRLTYAYVAGAENVGVQGPRTTFFTQRMSGQNRIQVRNALYHSVDPADSRIAIFQPVYRPTEDELTNKIMNIADFDFSTHYMASTYVYKYRGVLEAASNKMQGWTWMTYYRLPLVYTYLAEIANFEGNNGDVEKYMNMLRERAFGNSDHNYKAGSFLDNEVAILQEKAREFFQEGQRWWDLRRMTAVKNGADKDHMIFRPEGCLGNACDLKANPMWIEVTNNAQAVGTYTIAQNTPLLDYATQKHLVLWPVNNGLLGLETELMQTPGYDPVQGGKCW